MYTFCGRNWAAEDLARIRELIAERPNAKRCRLSRVVCEAFDWRSPNGKLKEMSCRVAMLKMLRGGLIDMPAPSRKPPGHYRLVETPESDPQPSTIISIHALAELAVVPVERGPMLRRWNEFVGRHHYLGYKMLPGAQIRYLIMDGERVLGAMGFGAGAWKLAPRDQFIGWTNEERERGLHLIVGQSRFLILPWIHCKNLASKTLAIVSKRLPDDWEERYGFRPVLLESFTDTERFRGTCYKAANWVNVGLTKGRGKLDTFNRFAEPVKEIWLKPLSADFRERLTGRAR